jgi:hypothetical protein
MPFNRSIIFLAGHRFSIGRCAQACWCQHCCACLGAAAAWVGSVLSRSARELACWLASLLPACFTCSLPVALLLSCCLLASPARCLLLSCFPGAWLLHLLVACRFACCFCLLGHAATHPSIGSQRRWDALIRRIRLAAAPPLPGRPQHFIAALSVYDSGIMQRALGTRRHQAPGIRRQAAGRWCQLTRASQIACGAR